MAVPSEWLLVVSLVVITALGGCLRRALRRGEASDLRAEQSERRSSELFHASPMPIVIANLASHRVVDVNDAFVQLSGWSREELIGTKFEELGILPLDIAAQAAIRLTRSGLIRNEAVVIRCKNGDFRHVVHASDLFMLDGEAHCRISIDDQTDRRRTELALETSEDQMRKAQKMESLGNLAGGIAHDFNNLLAVIAGNSSMLAEVIPRGTDSRDMIDDIESTVDRAVALTRQLLAFSRKQVTAPVVVNLNELVNETRKMLRRMIGDDVRIVTSLEPDLHNVMIDPGYLVQVLMNLAVNARDAMPRGGTITFCTRNDIGAVVLSVTDTGAGMSPQVRDRVFEPFFTTKEPGKGTGMGLAVVHGIIQQAGGRIEVTSELGVGTTFTIHVPSVASAAVNGRRSRTTIPHGVETLLVVDDDDYVRRTAARGLRSRGFNVVEASSGMAALRALDRSKIDLLLTDVVMPQMDGRELVEVATAAHPYLRVLYMSGCVDDLVIRHGVERAEVDLIEKPFKCNALAWKVRQVLDANVPLES
jgi:two-component system, cell cycle sensor histidine kinase and response regulator CckA